jgi:hypothetical protein
MLKAHLRAQQIQIQPSYQVEFDDVAGTDFWSFDSGAHVLTMQF